MPPRSRSTTSRPSRSRAAAPAAAPDSEVTALEPADTDLPVFGADEPDYADLPRHPFELEVQDVVARTRTRFALEAVGEPDGGAVIAFSAAQRRRGDEGAQAGAAIRILLSMLDDSDGVPSAWDPEPAGEGDDGSPTSWRDHDGKVWDTIDAAMPGLEQESSRRRFLHIVDDDRYHLPLSTVSKLARWLIGRGANRPTRRSTRSASGG